MILTLANCHLCIYCRVTYLKEATLSTVQIFIGYTYQLPHLQLKSHSQYKLKAKKLWMNTKTSSNNYLSKITIGCDLPTVPFEVSFTIYIKTFKNYS